MLMTVVPGYDQDGDVPGRGYRTGREPGVKYSRRGCVELFPPVDAKRGIYYVEKRRKAFSVGNSTCAGARMRKNNGLHGVV